MSTVVPGLIKIGQTMTTNFENRMRNLEHNGYSNVTGLKRVFAIEVDDYIEKESLLHTIFEKSRVGDTELFSLDLNIAKQLLSSFEGTVIYPKEETKAHIFEDAVEEERNTLEEKKEVENKGVVPDGSYYIRMEKISDGYKNIKATAIVENGKWKIKAGSIMGIVEDKGVTKKAKDIRQKAKIDKNGKLLEDVDLGVCTPSHAGVVVLNASVNGWTAWCDMNGHQIDIYRMRKEMEKKLTNNIAKRKSQHRKKRGTPPNPGKAYRAFHLYQRLRLPLAAVPANQETDDAEHPVNLHGNPHADDAHAHRRREENAEADAKNRHREDRDRHRVLRVARRTERVRHREGHRPENHAARAVQRHNLPRKHRRFRREVERQGNNRVAKQHQDVQRAHAKIDNLHEFLGVEFRLIVGVRAAALPDDRNHRQPNGVSGQALE